MKRRKIIAAIAILVLAPIAFVGYLLSRDPRQYHLSEGSAAVIALSGDDGMILQDSSSEDTIAILLDGDQVKIVEDPANDPVNRMRKVKVLIESGKYKGITGTVARIWIRPTSLLRGRVDF